MRKRPLSKKAIVYRTLAEMTEEGVLVFDVSVGWYARATGCPSVLVDFEQEPILSEREVADELHAIAMEVSGRLQNRYPIRFSEHPDSAKWRREQLRDRRKVKSS